MKLRWKAHIDRSSPDRAMELWAYGEPSGGATPYSYVAIVRKIDPNDGQSPPVWEAMPHELYENEYLYNLSYMPFDSRSSAMRETRKRFTIAWIGATAEERNAVWDGSR